MRKTITTILLLGLIALCVAPATLAGESDKRRFFQKPSSTPTPTPTFIPLPTFTPTPTETPTPKPTSAPSPTPTPLPFGVQGTAETPTGRDLLVALVVLLGALFIGHKVREGILTTAEKKITAWLKKISPKSFIARD